MLLKLVGKTSVLWKAKYGVGSKKDRIVNFKNLKNQWGGGKGRRKESTQPQLDKQGTHTSLNAHKNCNYASYASSCKEITLGFSISGCMTLGVQGERIVSPCRWQHGLQSKVLNQTPGFQQKKFFLSKISLELAIFHAAFQIRYIIICIKMCPHGNPASAAVSVLLSLSSPIPPHFPSLSVLYEGGMIAPCHICWHVAIKPWQENNTLQGK